MRDWIEIANAPCSWGVHFAESPSNPPWPQMLDEVASAGYSAVDLGPVGYFPTDPERLESELEKRGLRLSSGVLFDPFVEPSALPAILEKTRRTCKVLEILGAPRLVIIDRVSATRGATAGRSADSRRLDQTAWNAMMYSIKQTAHVAREEYGVSVFLHPHGGCFIEYEDELDRAMNDLPPEDVGLCIDTGHSAYAGIDPAVAIRRYGARIGLMHFKDVDAGVRTTCIRDRIGYDEAIERQIFCPLGEGVVDFAAVKEALRAIDYRGLAVVEQDPSDRGSPVDDARASFEFLRSVGLASESRLGSHPQE